MLHLTSIAHHRNGVCGVPFHVVLFKNGKENMIGIKFDNQPEKEGFRNNETYTAVLNVDKLIDGDIAFGSNSYRGDEFDVDISVWDNIYETERSKAANKETAREARAQETMKAFAEEEARRAA